MPESLPSHAAQDQFLNVIDRDEAERRYRAVLDLHPLEAERVLLSNAWRRILAEDIIAPVDVPSFDRANVDGFAVRAADTFGASDDRPVRLHLNAEELATGVVPRIEVKAGTATLIATGGVVPRGADAIVMVEYTDVAAGVLILRRPTTPGAAITHAGTDIGMGETVLRQGERLTSRETGVLAALGLKEVAVVRRPRVAILSTGDELIAPGEPMRTGLVYDSNATILADAVRELGGVPAPMGIVPDNAGALRIKLQEALVHDLVILSGGTSKGAGDVSYRVVGELGSPGIVVHGVALKPGKPLCLAAIDVATGTTPEATRRKPIAILPGFPTSAIFTFHEFIAPLIRLLSGQVLRSLTARLTARLPFRVNSERGRTEYMLVGLVEGVRDGSAPQSGQPAGLTAYPMGKGSGSVTTFSKADGFITIPRQREYLEEDEAVEVQLLGEGLQLADLVVIGSHCVGLDMLLGLLQRAGWCSKVLAVGSTAGLMAAQRGECDLAGIHLFDPRSGEYNRPFLTPSLLLITGYKRRQGFVHRQGDARFDGRALTDAVAAALSDPKCRMVNRNRGSGTRILIDGLIGNSQPAGYFVEARTHNAVAAAIVQGRADWGVCIESVSQPMGLRSIPAQAERYDFVCPLNRAERPAVQAFRRLLDDPDTRKRLAVKGFES